MKTRTFFITLFAPFVLYLLAAQAALTTWNLFTERHASVSGLQLSVMLEDSVSSETASGLSLKVSEITGTDVRVVTPDEQLVRFNSEFKVDVASVLSDNPFGMALFSSISADSDPASVKSGIVRLQGVRSVIYPDEERNELEYSFNERINRCLILDAILLFALIFQVWMAERLEGAANEPILANAKSRRVPFRIIRRTFMRRSFIKGVSAGILAAAAFMAISHDDIDRSLVISCCVVIASALLTYIVQLFAFPVANKNSR